MLRYVFKLFRRRVDGTLEEWKDYMQRTSHQIQQMSDTYGLRDWVSQHRKRKWQFAGRTVRTTDDRWCKVLLQWLPDGGSGRRQGRPQTKWSNDIVSYVGDDWINSAQDIDFWSFLEPGYVAGGFSND
eukprot:11510706-Karenia_brevis.AAC.1